jgi:PB1 domain
MLYTNRCHNEKGRKIISCKYFGLKNFLIKYHDKEDDLVTITTIEELNLAEESADLQNLVRLYISEGMKLYSGVVVCEEAREIFEVVQGELKISNKRLSWRVLTVEMSM